MPQSQDNQTSTTTAVIDLRKSWKAQLESALGDESKTSLCFKYEGQHLLHDKTVKSICKRLKAKKHIHSLDFSSINLLGKSPRYLLDLVKVSPDLTEIKLRTFAQIVPLIRQIKRQCERNPAILPKVEATAKIIRATEKRITGIKVLAEASENDIASLIKLHRSSLDHMQTISYRDRPIYQTRIDINAHEKKQTERMPYFYLLQKIYALKIEAEALKKEGDTDHAESAMTQATAMWDLTVTQLKTPSSEYQVQMQGKIDNAHASNLAYHKETKGILFQIRAYFAEFIRKSLSKEFKEKFNFKEKKANPNSFFYKPNATLQAFDGIGLEVKALMA